MKTMKENSQKKIEVGNLVRKYALLIVFIVLCAVFSILSDSFLTVSNLMDVVRSNAISGLLAVGVTYAILSGGIDLSTESVAALAGIVAGTLSYNPVVGVLMGLAIGVFFGTFNGLLVVKTGVQPFIFTLGTSRLVRGIIMIYTRGMSLYDISPEFRQIAKGDLGGVPIPIIIFVVIVAVSYILLNRGKYGRYVYAVGSNEEAARLSGIRTTRIKISTYIISGTLAALGGIMLTSRVAAAEANAADGWSLDAISAVIIGGTSLRGGQGGILYTMLGIFIIAVLNNGMVLLNVPSNYYQFIKGLLMIVAVLLDMNKGRKKA